MRVRIGKNPAAVRMTTAQDYKDFAFDELASGRYRLTLRHPTGQQVWIDLDDGEGIALHVKLCAAFPLINTRARQLAREIIDRSRDEKECNTIEDAVELAKLVLQLEV